MKQVLVIHGGTTFASYDTYLDYLRTKKVQLDRLTYTPNWKHSLQSKLGDNYQVLLPSMPNATNAQYQEWRLWFERICEVISDDVILIGHSLGGIFLAKYLSERELPVKVAASILIAAPFNDETDEELGGFKIQTITELFKKQAGTVILFHGTDDPGVAISEHYSYKRELPDAEHILTTAPDHFVRADFPELIDKIKALES